MQIGPIAGRLKKVQVGQQHDPERIFGLMQGNKCPLQQSEKSWVGIVVTSETDQEFADIHRRCIPANIGAQDQMGGQ